MASLVERLLALFFVASTAHCFNLDTQHYTLHRSEQGSMFGFSVAAHQEGSRSWVMVGAPEAQSTTTPNVQKGGAVFKCDPSYDSSCSELFIDRSDIYLNGSETVNKTGQWLGATISSGGVDSPFLACAPRYVTVNLVQDRRDPVGTCFLTKNEFNEVFEFAPCRTRNWGYHRQGSCQAGLGAAVSRNGGRLFIGAPGSYYWQGQLYSIDPSVIFPFMPPRYKEYGEGQLYSQNTDLPKTPAKGTSESKSYYDNSYLGYSVTTGYFNGNDEICAAVGMPRGADLRGKVVMYTSDLKNLQNITGEQMGGYFGYSLTTADVDGDGLEDLIVGAPFYTIPNNEGKYETGRIYVIYQSERFSRVHFRDGVNSKSRFGLAVSGLRDINLDGYDDFAVGAPYDGKNERGAVYIYHGGPDGVLEKPSQIIRAEDVSQATLKTFGFSISGGIDLDRNEYSDLVVGAYESDSAVLFRAKPVVKMTAGVEFVSSSKFISLDDKKCQLRNKQRVACAYLKYCLQYNGINVDSSVANGYICEMDFILNVNLDSQKTLDPRLFFLDDERKNSKNITITLYNDQIYCNNVTVYIKDNIRDKLAPLEVEMHYYMLSSVANSADAPRRRNPRSTLLPILDQNSLNMKKTSINIQKNCGSDNICIPDLTLTAESRVKDYLLGSNEELIINVIVQNFGEDAFEAAYNLLLPPGINYIKINQTGGTDIPVQCSPKRVGNDAVLKCDIGNPLPKDKIVDFDIKLEPSYKPGMPLFYDFQMNANSTNPERNDSLADNIKNITVSIWVETKFEIESYPNPHELHYNMSMFQGENITHEADLGPQVIHIYSFKNKGASTIDKAEVFVAWPFETPAGESLMYVVESPKYYGNIQCERADHVNDLDLYIDPKRKSYVEALVATLKGERRAGVVTGVVSESGSESNFQSSMHGGSSSGTTINSSESKSYSYSNGSQTFVSGGQGIRTEEERVNGNYGQGSTLYGQGIRTDQASAGQGGGKVITKWTYNRTQDGKTVSTGGSYVGGGSSTGGFQSGTLNTNQDNINQGRPIYSSQGVYGGHASNEGMHFSNERSKSQSNEDRYIEQDGRRPNTFNQQEGFIGGNTGKQSFYSEGNQDVGGGELVNKQFGQGTTWTSGERPAMGARNYTYTTSWNSTQSGSGPVITHYSNKNSSVLLGKDGRVISSESSTEYYKMGENTDGSEIHNKIGETNSYETRYYSNSNKYGEGQGRSKENDYYGQSGSRYHSGGSYVQPGRRIQGGSTYVESGERFQGGIDRSQSRERNQGGNIRYGSGSYSSGGAKHVKFGDDRFSDEYNSTAYQQSNQNRDNDGNSFGTQYKLSTEETVNKDLMNGGSVYMLNQGSTADEIVVPGNTYVGAKQDPVGLGAFASGSGFRVSTVDLGQLNSEANQNARTSASGERLQGRRIIGHSGGRSEADRSQGGFNTHQSHSSSYETKWEGDSDDIEQESDSMDRPGKYFKWDNVNHRRQRRLAPKYEEINARQLNEAMNCSELHCSVLRCVTGPLETNDEIFITLRARVNVRTLQKFAFDKPVSLTSVGIIRVLELPHIGKPLERPPHAQEAVTVLTPLTPLQQADPVPLWVVVLAACVGTALLLLLIYVMYKCRFFERNRPEAPERQPLNRNGYGHGDEQL